jgi:hypothetical protein
MGASLDRVRHELRAFLDGGSFWPLWHSVMDATEIVDSAPDLTQAERDWFDALYELVYMGADEQPTPDERTLGLLGPAELRSRLQALEDD